MIHFYYKPLTCGYAYLLAAHSDADVVAQGRDGLFEIYNNIVSNFIEQMIAEADRYANYNAHGWYGRNNDAGVEAQLHDSDGQVDTNISCVWITQGVSYSYSSIDRIADYTSKLNEEDVNEGDNWSDYNEHKVGENKAEWEYWWITAPGGYEGDPILSPLIWAGIDCRGFIQRVSKAPIYSGSRGMIITNAIIPDLGNSLTLDNLRYNIGCPDYRWVPDEYLDNTPLAPTPGNESIRRANTYWIQDNLEYIHRGDIITTVGHVVMVYDEPPDDQSTSFNIVNAYGSWHENLNGDPEFFTRRCIIFPLNIWRSEFSMRVSDNSVRYGRFTLWIR